LLLIGIEVNFTSFRIERLIVPKNLGNPPSNAHAYRLYIFNEPDSTFAQRHRLALSDSLRSAKPSIMTDFLASCLRSSLFSFRLPLLRTACESLSAKPSIMTCF